MARKRRRFELGFKAISGSDRIWLKRRRSGWKKSRYQPDSFLKAADFLMVDYTAPPL